MGWRARRLGGAVVPVTVTAGNVTVSFGVLSYAGTLAVTVAADPGRLPHLGSDRCTLAGTGGCGPGTNPLPAGRSSQAG